MGRMALVGLVTALMLAVVVPLPASAAAGDQLWVTRYTGRPGGGDGGKDVAVSPDGSRVFVTGSRAGEATSDYLTAAYDAATGAQLWVQRYGSEGRGDDQPVAVGVSPDGTKVFVTGTGQGVGFYSIVTIAYDAATGAKLWLRRYTGPDADSEGFAMSMSPNGNRVYVAGSTFRSDTGTDYVLVAYRSDTGTRIWARRYDGTSHAFDEAHAVAVRPDGRTIYVTGTSTSDTGLDFATVAFGSESGTKIWVRRYDGDTHGYDQAVALGVSPDGDRVFVTGSSEGSRFDYATVAYDAASGAEDWRARYDAPGGGNDEPTALAVAPGGALVFVSGSSIGQSAAAATIAYDSVTGAAVWTRRFTSPEHLEDFTQDMAVSADGAFLSLAMYTETATEGFDYGTVTYRAATGAEAWSRRYDGPANGDDFAAGIALSPDGTEAVVTGASRGPDGSYDVATVAYLLA